MKKIFLFFIFSVSFLLATEVTYDIELKSNSNIRTCASADCEYITTLKKGIVIEKALYDKWYTFEYQGKQAYVSNALVIVLKEHPSLTTNSSKKEVSKPDTVIDTSNAGKQYYLIISLYVLFLMSIGIIGGYATFLIKRK